MKSSTSKIALCGIFSALSIVLLFLASLIGIGTFAGPVIASVLIQFITIEYDKKSALLTYIAVSLLAVFLMPDRELSAFYVCFGWYPVIREYIRQRLPKFLRALLNLAIYSIAIFVYSYFVLLLTGIPFGEGELSALVIRIMFFAGALTFLLLDKCYDKTALLWKYKLRKIFLPK